MARGKIKPSAAATADSGHSGYSSVTDSAGEYLSGAMRTYRRIPPALKTPHSHAGLLPFVSESSLFVLSVPPGYQRLSGAYGSSGPRLSSLSQPLSWSIQLQDSSANG